MTTTYYVVPAGRAFDTSFPWFGNYNAARKEADQRSADDGHDYGIYAVELTWGTRKTAWGDTVRVCDDREVVVSKCPDGQWRAYADEYGPEVDGLFGYGATEQEAIDECLHLVADDEMARFAKRIDDTLTLAEDTAS